MRYWNAMLDKYGFQDGESVPDGVTEYREAYLMAVNTLAQERGSRFRVEAYDRPGLHNPCMILFHDLDGIEQNPDNLMDKAVEEAHTCLDVDSYVVVSVSLDKTGLEDALVNRGE